MAPGDQPFSYPPGQPEKVRLDRSTHFLDGKKAMTSGMSFPFRERGGASACLSTSKGRQASKKRALQNWPIATLFWDLRGVLTGCREVAYGCQSEEARAGLGGRRPIDEAGQSALP
jgi:hypothetical protein